MKRFLIFILFGVFAVTTAFAQLLDPPVAEVNLIRTVPITVKQLRLELEKQFWPNMLRRFGRFPTQAELTRESQNSTKDERLFVLNVMINENLALQAAERDRQALPPGDRERLNVTENEISQHMQMLMAQLPPRENGRPPTESDLIQAIKEQTGMDLPAYRETIRRQAIVQKYLLFKKEDEFKSIKDPTDAEILSEYNLNRSMFVRPDTVRFSFIQVPFGPDAASRARAKELADRLISDIGANSEKFEDTVRRGQTPNAGFQAGTDRYIYRNPESQREAGQNFFDAAFSLKQGEISKVIDGLLAYQIIRNTEFLPQKTLELDDVYNLGARNLMTVKQFIQGGMLQRQQQELLAKVTQDLAAELRKGTFSAGNSFRIIESNLNW